MLRFGYQNSWEIFLTVYKRFSECWSSQSTLPPKGETITFLAGECLAWLACGVKVCLDSGQASATQRSRREPMGKNRKVRGKNKAVRAHRCEKTSEDLRL